MNIKRAMLVVASAGFLFTAASAHAAGTSSSNSSVKSIRLVIAAARAGGAGINIPSNGGGSQSGSFTPPSAFVDPRIVPGNGVILRIPRHGPRSRGTGSPFRSTFRFLR